MKCVMCGYHCMVAPCEHGELHESGRGCKYLLPPNVYGQRLCGKYDEIIASGKGHVFGAGCPATLFNSYRRAVIISLGTSPTDSEHEPPSQP